MTGIDTETGAASRTATWVVRRWAAGTALVTLSVLVVVLLAGGGAPQPVPAGLPDPGAATGWGLPVARLLAGLAGVATVGLLLAAALLLPSPADRLADVPRRGVALAAGLAALWLVAVAAEVVLTVSDIFGVPLAAGGRPDDAAQLPGSDLAGPGPAGAGRAAGRGGRPRPVRGDRPAVPWPRCWSRWPRSPHRR